jgi:hypothetical protein
LNSKSRRPLARSNINCRVEILFRANTFNYHTFTAIFKTL